MSAHNKKFLYAIAALVGTMVGVGIFGLPFAFSKAGFWVGMSFLLGLTLSTMLVDLMYGEVVLRTHDKHQLMGYTRKYLGATYQKMVFFAATLTGYVGLLAYIIISGDFLSTLLSPFFYTPLGTYSILFGVIMSFVALKGIKTISRVELFFGSLFITVILLIFLTGFSSINTVNFQGFNREFFFLPYGILLFALGGLVAVPIQRQILAGQEHRLRWAVVIAVALTAALYALFTTTVVGISGEVTTPDAVSGLYEFLGSKITILSALFGAFAITTAFLMHATVMIDMFHYDYRVKRFHAWILVVVPPMLLFLAGIRTFVDIISLAGGVALGFEQIMIVLLYAKAKSKGDRIPEYSMNIPLWLLYLLMAVFASGIIYFLFIH